jgi:triacylglycerol esterase/lipase EstA (alpha/beta hydrolase family)
MMQTLTRSLLLGNVLLGGFLAFWLSELTGFAKALLVLASAVAAPLLVQACALLTTFGLSRIVASPIPAGFDKGPLATIKAYLGEVLDSTRTFLWLMPFQANYPEWATTTNNPKPAVLLVHGFVCNRGLWLPLARLLETQGYRVHSISLEPVWGSIDEYLPQMHKAFADLTQGHQAVVMVGHSMGGLVIRNFLRSMDTQQRGQVAHVITLGTPHHGTVHARFGQGHNAAQMRRNSPWLQTLLADEKRRGGLGVPATLVLSHHDNIVAPQADQVPAWPTPVKLVALSGVGHLSLAFHPTVIELIQTIAAQADKKAA